MTDPIHLLLVGNSGSGKTGSLISLIEAGYNLYVIDLDNGLRILRNLIKAKCPEKADNLHSQTITDRYKIGKMGARPKGPPQAMVKAGAAIDKWIDEIEWTEKDVLVIDSLTALGRACLAWAKAQNPTVKDNRQHYFNAQQVIEPIVESLTSEDASYNLLVLTHITTQELKDSKGDILSAKGFPSSVGQALNDKLGTHFNDVFEYRAIGTGTARRRQICSVSNLLDLKTSSPLTVKKNYPIETGLADLFTDLSN